MYSGRDSDIERIRDSLFKELIKWDYIILN
jgi:hypothetical protein